jgi:hypothetical protein
MNTGTVCKEIQLHFRHNTDNTSKISGCKCRRKLDNDLKMHIEELQNLYSSPNVIRIMKPRRMRWAGHAARIREKRIM